MPVGAFLQYSRVFTQEQVLSFASLSGDDNPIHWDAKYAATTRFQKYVACVAPTPAPAHAHVLRVRAV
ncbi:hypothetical protein EON67_10030 [archaeon]|nr:MAG: hypothetical protein EON67_10030 [archaeon]